MRVPAAIKTIAVTMIITAIATEVLNQVENANSGPQKMSFNAN
jgi:hypothetical protein